MVRPPYSRFSSRFISYRHADASVWFWQARSLPARKEILQKHPPPLPCLIRRILLIPAHINNNMGFPRSKQQEMLVDAMMPQADKVVQMSRRRGGGGRRPAEGGGRAAEHARRGRSINKSVGNKEGRLRAGRCVLRGTSTDCQ